MNTILQREIKHPGAPHLPCPVYTFSTSAHSLGKGRPAVSVTNLGPLRNILSKHVHLPPFQITHLCSSKPKVLNSMLKRAGMHQSPTRSRLETTVRVGQTEGVMPHLEGKAFCSSRQLFLCKSKNLAWPDFLVFQENQEK